MKPISVHVPEDAYEELKSLAARTGRPVAELIREAMAEYLDAERTDGRPLLSLPAHDSGRMLSGWTRSELADEMHGR